MAEQLGAGPFFLVENVPLENITSRGEAAEFVHHSAFGYCGGGPIELMEMVRLVPERIEGRFSGARPGVHHVAWAVPPASVEDLRRELEDRGLPEYLSAQLGEIDITFHDASASLGHDIEIHVDSQGLRDFFQMALPQKTDPSITRVPRSAIVRSLSSFRKLLCKVRGGHRWQTTTDAHGTISYCERCGTIRHHGDTTLSAFGTAETPDLEKWVGPPE